MNQFPGTFSFSEWGASFIMTFQPVFEVAGLPDVKLACWVLEDIDREFRHEMRKPHLRGASIYIAGPTRLELATSGLTGRRSNQTELRSLIFT